jgi:hypothetical protein
MGHEAMTACCNFSSLCLVNLCRMHCSHEDVSLNDTEVLFVLAEAIKYVQPFNQRFIFKKMYVLSY